MVTSDDKIGSRYMQSILFLIVVLAVFELVNSGLNIALLLQQNKVSAERSKVTRDVVVVVGYCLKQRDVNTRAEIEKCVEKTLGRPLNPVGSFK